MTDLFYGGTQLAMSECPNDYEDDCTCATCQFMRHFEAWRAGEILDPDSHLPHLAHVTANALILLALEIREEDAHLAHLRFDAEYRTIQSVSGKQESREAGWGDGEIASAWG